MRTCFYRSGLLEASINATSAVGRAAALGLLTILTAGALVGCQAPNRPVDARQPITREMLDRRDVDFDGDYARGLTWLPDGRGYLQRQDGELVRVDVLTGAAEVLEDEEEAVDALTALEGVDERTARRMLARPRGRTEDRQTLLLEHNDRLYLYARALGEVRQLTADAAERQVVSLAPTGDAVAYVLDNNLYVLTGEEGAEPVQLTQDGSETLLNGILDWVYQEEVYGRGNWQAHWWRDDGAFIAFLQLDESDVPLYTLVNYMPHPSSTEQTRYPKPGDPMPRIRLGLVPRQGGDVAWADLSQYGDEDILITRVTWAPDGRVLFSVQDREQRWLELNAADPQTGEIRRLIREESPAWANNLPHPHWLPDGSFLWLSERDGFAHLYHCDRDGQLIHRLTEGPWAVEALAGVDEAQQYVYFTGVRETTLETHAYRVPLAGGEIELLTTPGYHHRVDFDPTCTYFIDSFSNVRTPTNVHLCLASGELVRAISENRVDTVREYAWSTPELLQLPNREGKLMNCALVRPVNFDPQRKYPVLCPVYGGPGAATVRNRWAGRWQLRDQYLANQGYIIFRCDPHSATPAVAAAAWDAFHHLGRNELDDLEDALDWLISQGYADPERIGIMGYSYGGYFAAYALTHSERFRLGIAGAPVSDWANYDSIYTERFMGLPDNNPEGYAEASVSKAAGQLKGRLLIVHGLLDDNVHFQNTAQLIDALQQANEPFDLMVYPRDRHGIGRGARHFRDLELRYILELL